MQMQPLKTNFKKYSLSFASAVLLSHGFLSYNCLTVSANDTWSWEQVQSGLDYLIKGVVDAITSGSIVGGLSSFAQAAIYSGVTVAHNEWIDANTPITISATDCSGVVGYYVNGETGETMPVMLFGLDGVSQDITSSYGGTLNDVVIENFCVSDDFAISAYITPNDGTWLEGDYIKCTTTETSYTNGIHTVKFIFSVMNDTYDDKRTFRITFHNSTTSYLFQGTVNDTSFLSTGYGNVLNQAPGFSIGTYVFSKESDYTIYSATIFNNLVNSLPLSGCYAFNSVYGDDLESNIVVGKNISGVTHMTCPPGDIVQNDYDSYSNYINHDFRDYVTTNYPDYTDYIYNIDNYYPREEEEPATGDNPPTVPSTDPTYAIEYPGLIEMPTFPSLPSPEIGLHEPLEGAHFWFYSFTSLIDKLGVRWIVIVVLMLSIVIMMIGR